MVANFTQTNETKIQAIARQLLSQGSEKSSLFGKLRDSIGLDANARWDDKLMQWAMENPNLRLQLFQLIDCLPTLKTKAAIARHIQEYLGQADVELPGALKGLLQFANPDSLPGQVAAGTMVGAVETLAQRYIAGETTTQVLKTINRLRSQHLTFTLDLLGEAVISEVEAQQYLDRYLQLMTELTQASKSWSHDPQIDLDGLAKVQVSVKLTAFYSQFDPLDVAGSITKVSDRVRTLLRKAKELGCAVHFDMEQYQYKAVTLMALKQLLMEPEFRDRDDVGITVQVYLRDSGQDLQGLIDWAKERGTPVTIRLVKGAYWDQETIKAIQHGWESPVYRDKAETDQNFEQLTQLLLENNAYLYAAIGSHNARSQANAMALAETLAIPPRRIEFQALYGMADSLLQAMAQKGHRVRVYCPYGDLLPGMSYLIRRLLENTANTSFLRQRFEQATIETLIAPPQVTNQVPTKTKSRRFQNTSDRDYADAKQREQGQTALQQVKTQLGKSYQPLINGEWVSTAQLAESLNPSDRTCVGKVGLASIEQAESTIQAAKQAFQTWRQTPVIDRAKVLDRMADLLQEHRDELAAWICLEVGKPLHETNGEVSEAIDFCRYYAREMEWLAQGSIRDYPGETNRYHYQGRGVVVVISPWNFPLAIPIGMTVAALVAGNSVILKPATTASVIAAKFSELLVQAGVPAGVFNYLPADGGTVGNYLVQHKDIHMIVFTGSQSVGCQIYADAAKLQPGQRHLKRVVAEMGGKNAVIIDSSADLDQAVQGVVHSAFGYSGQKCSAASRAIVLESVYEAFLERLVAATQSLNIGAADLPSTNVGPVIDAKAQAKIQEWIAKGKAEATIALEMTTPNDGYFVPPTIFRDVAPDAAIAQNEIFGPVLAVIPATTFEQALEIANDTDYALTGGIYSRTPSHIAQAQANFEVGNLYINRGITGAIVDRQPFGGFKLSGVGSKAGGIDYLLQFLEPRVITENVQRQGFAPITMDDHTIAG
jgi:RHH-type transcriptional regulator, proline utilization regulon repressor / proline dehydrogenase / delta 1-pyrroline-5-carboxylate dehydrogenase